MKKLIVASILLSCLLLFLPAGGAHYEFRYLALGDSYTIGKGVSEEERWPAQVAQILEQDLGYSVQVEYRAQSGWTTRELLESLDSSPVRGSFDLLTLLIGVNNQYLGQDIESYSQDFAELLKRSLVLVGEDPTKVKVLSIPDYRFTPFGNKLSEVDQERVSQEIDEYNQIARELSNALGIAFLDITPVSRQGLQNPSIIAPDGLHLSGTAYNLFATRVVQDIVCRLE